MNDNNYPWPMDKPIEEIAGDINCSYEEAIRYLLDRLKIAEAERDEMKKELDLLFPPAVEIEEF